jgi:hypothetical protein
MAITVRMKQVASAASSETLRYSGPSRLRDERGERHAHQLPPVPSDSAERSIDHHQYAGPGPRARSHALRCNGGTMVPWVAHGASSGDTPRQTVIVAGGRTRCKFASAPSLRAVGHPVALWKRHRLPGRGLCRLPHDHGTAGKPALGTPRHHPSPLGLTAHVRRPPLSQAVIRTPAVAPSG